MHFEEQLRQKSLEETTLGLQVVGLEAPEPPLGLHGEFGAAAEETAREREGDQEAHENEQLDRPQQ